MAETISSPPTRMEISLKDTSMMAADLTPVAMLHNSPLARTLRNLKHGNNVSATAAALDVCAGGDSSDVPTALDMKATSGGGVSTSNVITAPTSAAMTTFRCERCDHFETTSRASLLLHVVQCLSSPTNGAAVKAEDGSGGEQDAMSNKSDMQLDQSSPTIMVVNGQSSSANGGITTNSTSSTSSSSRKVFECDVCNMKFSNGANMRRHKMRHTGVKPYECRVCQKRFFRKDHLAEHFTTHTKTLPYHCPICNRGFQRQIAMRAHFQNEHVGQHDLVKTCPLCSYRAGSMKSLRIHFFNRHGIDLDNPGPGGTSSLLLALESQASQVAAAAAAAGFVNQANLSATGLNALAANAAANSGNPNSNSGNVPSHQSDSGESLRSMENATPPMHFLTPHVEISTLQDGPAGAGAVTQPAPASMCTMSNGSELFNVTPDTVNTSDENALLCVLRAFALQGGGATVSAAAVGAASNAMRSSPAAECMDARNSNVDSASMTPTQDQPLDYNSKSLPSSTTNGTATNNISPKSHQNHHLDNHIKPSISLIPIKQEPVGEEFSNDLSSKSNMNANSCSDQMNSNAETAVETDLASSHNSSNNNSKVTSLIKVSPLKSLLREDLKRRICAKASNRITRNAAALENNNVIQSSMGSTNVVNCNGSPNAINSSNGNSTPICNGTITSTGQDNDASMLSRLTCHFCGIEFPDDILYFLHKGCHSIIPGNPWKCNICGEQLNNVYEFNSHLLSKSHQ